MSAFPESPTADSPIEEWARVYTDPSFWRPAIDEILQRHGLGEPTQVVPGYPGTNAVFIVNDRLVVKIAWPYHRQGFYRELELYRLLERWRDERLTPRVIAEGLLPGGPSWPYVVTEYLPGARLGAVWPQVPRGDQIAIAEQLGELVWNLHQVPSDSLKTVDPSRAGWQRFVAERAEQCIEDYRNRGGLPPHLIVQVPAYLEETGRLFPPDFAPVILNGDVTFDHELLALVEGHWRITGFIDFDDTLVGHYEYEFTCVHLWTFSCDFELTCMFLRAYGWDGKWDERFSQRMMAYSLLHPYFDFRPWIEQLGGPHCVDDLHQLERALWHLPGSLT